MMVGSDPAFPLVVQRTDDKWYRGMDLRTYVATAVLQGRIAFNGMPPDGYTSESRDAESFKDRCADECVRMADALIRRLGRD